GIPSGADPRKKPLPDVEAVDVRVVRPEPVPEGRTCDRDGTKGAVRVLEQHLTRVHGGGKAGEPDLARRLAAADCDHVQEAAVCTRRDADIGRVTADPSTRRGDEGRPDRRRAELRA